MLKFAHPELLAQPLKLRNEQESKAKKDPAVFDLSSYTEQFNSILVT